MKVVVLGSGIIGTATAWWLNQAGHDVVVVDREVGPAQEASRANGCQISVSYSEPWANPQAPRRLLKWLFQKNAPLSFHPQLDMRQWIWGLAFLRECMPGRLAPNIRAMVAMAEYSLHTLQAMRSELDIEYHQVERGILNFYRDEAELDASQKAAGVMRNFGVDRRIISPDEVVQIEPALAPIRQSIVGGDYTAQDESGDIYLFTVALAERARKAGVEFRYSNRVSRLVAEGGQVQAVELIDANGLFQTLSADAYVAALGCWTPHFVVPLGVPCLVYPAKGYSATFNIIDESAAPTVSLTDSAHKVVYSRLGGQLRMAGVAEVGGYSRALNTKRCENMSDLARGLFPTALDFDTVQHWSGLRPSTPSNVPLIGRTRISNLYLNTGHGTLGWTMGVGSGRALADIISGNPPEPVFPFLG
jgi:D-amino-acid dehydrogenase